MGLMKISTYHKILGDEVHFVKGTNPSIDAEVWDRIYVTTLFTFDFAISVETINHYMRLVDDVDSLYVGGIMASLMPDKIIEATGIERSHILTGLFTDTSVVGDHNNDDNMTQLARLAIRPLRIAFDDIKLKDKYCAAVRTAHKHGIKEISNYILFNYKDKPEDLYERLRINIELNRELGIQIFSFPMKYSPIDRTDRDFIGTNWTKKSIRAISAILQVTKGVVAAGSDFFYKAFGSSLDEYLELLAMPRELIMFRYHFEENGTTAQWQKLYRALSEEQKKELMIFVSHTVSELRILPCPEQFKKILPFYLIKYNGKTEQLSDDAVQLSFMDDSDVVIEEE